MNPAMGFQMPPYEQIHVLNPKEFPHCALWSPPGTKPTEIFVQGGIEGLQIFKSLPFRGLAIVGTRYPCARSIQITRDWILKLAGSDLVIVSGLAVGIDAAAHQAALEAGLKTVAILGAGFGINYPRPNERLRERILRSGGMLISEYPPHTPARAGHFPERNRLIAALSNAILVIEAKHQSGALVTARWGLEAGRDCYVVPSYPGDAALAGCLHWLAMGWARAATAPEDLGATWLELPSCIAMNRVPKVQTRGKLMDELSAHVNAMTKARGGITAAELLNWAISRGFSRKELFEGLASGQRNREWIDDHGLLRAARS